MPSERLAALAREGATVVLVGGPPADVPGWGTLDARRAELRDALRSIGLEPGGGAASRRLTVGKGSVRVGDDVELLLAQAGVAREPMTDAGVRFVRRAHPRGVDYFLVNRGGAPVDGWVKLGTTARSALLLDPRSPARSGVAALKAASEVYLQLDPGESAVLRTFASEVAPGEPWPYAAPVGDPEPLAGPWRLAFVEGGPVLPAFSELPELASWTTLADAEAQRFAGTGRYTVRFERPTGDASDWLLDLGRVAETARVTLNGRDLGTLFSRPFRLRVGEALRPGTNTLQVEVTNLAANRVRDLDRRGVPWKAFHDANVVDVDYKPLDASAWPLRESGLLGPVTLRRLRAASPGLE